MLLNSKNVAQTAIVLLALGNSTAATSSSTGGNSTGTPPCDAIIEAGLGHRLLFATDSHSWSGHNIAHTNSIDTGVTTDLGYLNKATYDIKINVASVSPGSHRQYTYAELHKPEEKNDNTFSGTLKGQNSILWTATSLVYTNQSDLTIAERYMREIIPKLKSLSASVGGDNDLIYLNYADSLQDSLGSYPKENVKHMKRVAAKYDPEGKFQTRFPDGFKISRVDDA